MSDIKLDLTKTRIFGQDELIIDKKLTFIFGKNGTGKSTLTSLFKSQMKESQMKDFDVSCFQGFDDILGEDEKLNAVVLGEENNEINNQIKSLEDQISEKVKEIKKLEKETQKSEEKPNNLWQEVENSKNYYQEQTNKINNFCTKAASKIKNITNPQVASTNYNINNFKDEIGKAKSLTNEEIKSRETLIKTDVKTATRISYKEIELNHLLDFTNTLLLKKVEEQVIIPEFLGNPLKRDFAEQGLKIHAINNNCAFCGNAVSKERYEKLKRYFSADDVDKFKKEINSHINILNNTINNIKEVHLSTSDFYPEYLVEVNQVIVSFNSKKEEVLKFLNTLKEATDNKSKYLFEECKTVGITIPHQFKEEVDKYNGLVDKNNISDLKTKQKQARDELRYNEIKKYIDSFKYNEEVSERDKLEGEYSAKNSELEKKKLIISKKKYKT
ncbi:AAA family ATPase [Seminibacterium arietis]|uniref:AAA family ATPase n=1 Tax=Seminibacterium arietis TaxID=1173502 RepID=A0ABW3I944_9PAST